MEQLEKDASGSNLPHEFCVGTSTMSDIKNQSESIKKFVSTLFNNSLRRKVMKTMKSKHLESAMYTWFMQIWNQGQPISGSLICEKALQMNGNPDFKATAGWLQHFKSWSA